MAKETTENDIATAMPAAESQPTEIKGDATAAPEKAQAKSQATPANAPGAKRKPRDNSPKSMPFLQHSVTLNSFHAQQVFKRAFGIGEEALFTLSVILRAIADESECVKVDQQVNEKNDDLRKSMLEEQARLEALADTYGIQATGLTYSAPQEVSVKVTSPRAVAWMGLIRDLDRMIELFDVLWLSHVIKDGEHSKGIFNAKRKMWRFANEVRTLAIRSMGSAQRRGADDVADPRSGTTLDPDAGKAPAVATPAEAPEAETVATTAAEEVAVQTEELALAA